MGAFKAFLAEGSRPTGRKLQIRKHRQLQKFHFVEANKHSDAAERHLNALVRAARSGNNELAREHEKAASWHDQRNEYHARKNAVHGSEADALEGYGE